MGFVYMSNHHHYQTKLDLESSVMQSWYVLLGSLLWKHSSTGCNAMQSAEAVPAAAAACMLLFAQLLEAAITGAPCHRSGKQQYAGCHQIS